MSVKRLAVYCGAAMGADPLYADTARELMRAMAGRGIELVYGGGRLGLMGVIADAMLEAGGKVHGVIPEALVAAEVAHRGITELHTVSSMAERKEMFAELADGFVCLPGGIGTLDELYEAWTGMALGYHAKPFVLLNVGGFWDGLAEFMEHVSEAGFLSEARLAQLLKAETPGQALDLIDEAVQNPAQGVTW